MLLCHKRSQMHFGDWAYMALAKGCHHALTLYNGHKWSLSTTIAVPGTCQNVNCFTAVKH